MLSNSIIRHLMSVFILFGSTNFALAEQALDVSIRAGDYLAQGSFSVNNECRVSGTIDWHNLTDGSRIIGENVSGNLACRTITIKRAPPGGNCVGTIDASGSSLTCTWNGLAAGLIFSPSVTSCGC